MDNQNEREYFTFYRSFWESIEQATETEQLALYRAIARYGLNQEEPHLSGMVNAVWLCIKPQLDANWRKYVNGCKGKDFGGQGGAPVGNRNAAKQHHRTSKTTPKQPLNNPTGQATQPLTISKTTGNKEIIKKEQSNKEQSNKEQTADGTSASVRVEKIDFENIISLWNKHCPSLPSVQMLNDNRKNKIRMRLHEMKSVQKMVEVFDRLERSDFCKGSTGWKATFDWFMSNDSNWVKVMEGNYDNRRSGKSLNINDEWNEPQPASKHDAVDDWERENQAMPQHTESEWK